MIHLCSVSIPRNRSAKEQSCTGEKSSSAYTALDTAQGDDLNDGKTTRVILIPPPKTAFMITQFPDTPIYAHTELVKNTTRNKKGEKI